MTGRSLSTTGRCAILVSIVWLAAACSRTSVVPSPPPAPSRGALAAELAAYHTALGAVRAGRPARALPDVRFFLFGMGARQKLLYVDGTLSDARTGATLHRWQVTRALIVPSAYTVALDTSDAGAVTIVEDERGIWLHQRGTRTALASTPVKLPTFADHPRGAVLRVLHQEILVNIVDGNPLPNLFVYGKPWYRDGAMMAMVLRETGNLDLVKDWILGLRVAFDRNNRGEEEADNLGQALYLISLVADRNHPLVPVVTSALPRFHEGDHVKGRSDFAFHPVYQTKWARFGLRALGLPDPYKVPLVEDSYSSLFWWDFKDAHVPTKRFGKSAGTDYPYLVWAEDIFHGEKNGPVGDRDYPLSWEARASEARYEGMRPVAPVYVEQRLSVPHTWHAAEMFFRLLGDRS